MRTLSIVYLTIFAAIIRIYAIYTKYRLHICVLFSVKSLDNVRKRAYNTITANANERKAESDGKCQKGENNEPGERVRN